VPGERWSADVVVVGAGPAGLAAAAHAAEAGAHVLVADEAPRPGGQVWRSGERPAAPAAPWLDRLARSGATLVAGASVIDAPATGVLLLDQGGAAMRVEYRRLVLATGARELFLPFPGWTLPGVLGAGAAQSLLKSGVSFVGRRVLVAGTGPLLLAVADALRAQGARVLGIVEQASFGRLAAFGGHLGRHTRKAGEALGYAARLLGVPYRTGAWVREATGSAGVERVVVTDGRREREWACDVLACGFGLVASLELPRLLGCETTAEKVVVDEAQRTSRPEVYAAGELTAIGGRDHALVTGAIAGLAAAGRSIPDRLRRQRERERLFAARLARTFALRDELRHVARPDTIVCRCEDATLGAIDAAGLGGGLEPPAPDAARRARLHTRAGMGPCQGRVCGAALGFLRDAPFFTIRPPLLPTSLATLAEGPDTQTFAAEAPAEEEP
jgi:NADPH-dependent 2,4-dienoyl-CoA reductase/sulfur reductase-like enzyme